MVNLSAEQLERIGAADRARYTVFCSILRTHNPLSSDADRDEADRVWRDVQRLPIDAPATAELLNACWQYAYAVKLRTGQVDTGSAVREKEQRRRIKQTAKEARDLVASISALARDRLGSMLLVEAFSDPAFSGLGALLLRFARALESRTLPSTQVQNALQMKRLAFFGNPPSGTRGMVELARCGEGRRGRVAWTMLARLVNLLGYSGTSGPEFSGVSAPELERDYKSLARA